MLTKALLFAFIAACGVSAGVHSNTKPEEQPDGPLAGPPEEEGQHFCCDSVDLKSKSGEGCVSLAPTQIDLCPDVLYCSGDWGKTNGKTQCLE
jgi:hypothetical protein